MRPRPKKVEAVEETTKPQAEYKRCSGCVSRKLCDDVNVCMYGKKKPKGKKKNVGNGRVSAK
jgi:hypothetical protein